ncbi:MAG TPA: HD domain-containing protein [Candidatus Saccharimonadales bacterium]|nr:HD domain-containing protein [Candidatus Saccharimonadales bacterium]
MTKIDRSAHDKLQGMREDNLQRDINFLFEMGNIRLIDRMWQRFWHENFANLADHHFRVFWIAMTIAAHEKGVDTGKVAKIALLHDITESRTGDVDYVARQYVDRNERLAITDMLQGTAIKQEFYALWEEYEQRESLESKIVKDADNLDVDFELAEQAASGSPLQAHWAVNRQFVAEKKLYTKTAKKIFKQLKTSDPHTWHMSCRNRVNSGDWQK